MSGHLLNWGGSHKSDPADKWTGVTETIVSWILLLAGLTAAAAAIFLITVEYFL